MGVYEQTAEALDGGQVDLAGFRGRVLLIVNTASQCGFTPQYEGLEALYRTYRDRGLEILGFPCNQFGGQEPGEAAQIRDFCTVNYGVDFPMFARIDVNGPAAHPLYAYLKRSWRGLLGSQAIKWNFTKFLVDRQGRVAGRFASTKTPQALASAIDKLL